MSLYFKKEQKLPSTLKSNQSTKKSKRIPALTPKTTKQLSDGGREHRSNSVTSTNISNTKRSRPRHTIAVMTSPSGVSDTLPSPITVRSNLPPIHQLSSPTKINSISPSKTTQHTLTDSSHLKPLQPRQKEDITASSSTPKQILQKLSISPSEDKNIPPTLSEIKVESLQSRTPKSTLSPSSTRRLLRKLSSFTLKSTSNGDEEKESCGVKATAAMIKSSSRKLLQHLSSFSSLSDRAGSGSGDNDDTITNNSSDSHQHQSRLLRKLASFQKSASKEEEAVQQEDRQVTNVCCENSRMARKDATVESNTQSREVAKEVSGEFLTLMSCVSPMFDCILLNS